MTDAQLEYITNKVAELVIAALEEKQKQWSSRTKPSDQAHKPKISICGPLDKGFVHGC